METYTPGPWFASEDGEVYSKSSYTSVAMVLMNESGPDNARLIAAAPDLLEALKLFVSEYVELVESGDAGFWDAESEEKVKKARAAIAKAEGRS